MRAWIEAVGAKTAFIEPGSPWENGYVESFNARMRAELYALVQACAASDWDECAARVAEGSIVATAADFENALAPYVEERGPVRFDARIRAGWTTQFQTETAQRWSVQQILVDDDEDAAWSIDGIVDLSTGADPAGPLVQVTRIGL